ncbi:hypothetical protein KIN20_035189 [Parelaphostrongylus tenuis]|uniref:Endoplasmic reticulum metallopeptidase 1-like C-terminal domain-containing protein n=1 Tax=Parelaphostrongylus tenuis TaxID=148309 RepID=A0AAD5RBE7_PARTN|nr:hypothetical protein KIN20_035189 [Parelaphostrongylus tenuis]
MCWYKLPGDCGSAIRVTYFDCWMYSAHIFRREKQGGNVAIFSMGVPAGDRRGQIPQYFAVRHLGTPLSHDEVFSCELGLTASASLIFKRVRLMASAIARRSTHTNRTIYNSKGDVVQRDNGLFVQSLDYRGAEDLPAHSFLQGSTPPNCTGTKDVYCRLPYYTAMYELFPPARSLWIPVPSQAPVPYPIKLTMIDRVLMHGNRLNITFELRGGYDKMSLHLTPLSGYELLTWSFTDIDIEEFGRRRTYFVFLTYGFEMPKHRSFWIVLENSDATPSDPENTDNIEIAVAAHHAHGEHQNSETLRQLRHLIQSRRETPEMAVGWWKWGMTIIAGVAEVVVHVF